MHPQLLKAFQAQAAREYRAAQTYLALSLWAGSAGYPGAQVWLRRASDEERTHGLGILDLLNDYVDEQPEVPSVPATRPRFDTLAAAFAEVLKLELEVTSALEELSEQAEEQGDHATHAFLIPYLREQIRGVSEVRNWARELQRAGENEAAVMLVDARLGATE